MNRRKRESALLGVLGLALAFVSSPAISESINFSGQLGFIEEDSGGIYWQFGLLAQTTYCANESR